MADQERAITKRSHQVSFRRLERKVDDLAVEVKKTQERVDAINLNGSAAALKRLADNSDQLLRLAQVAPVVVEAVEREADRAAAYRYLRRLFNPLRPLGAFIWLLFTTVVAAIAWNLITAARLPHH